MRPFRFLTEVGSIVILLGVFGNMACEADAEEWARVGYIVAFLVTLIGACSLWLRVNAYLDRRQEKRNGIS